MLLCCPQVRGSVPPTTSTLHVSKNASHKSYLLGFKHTGHNLFPPPVHQDAAAEQHELSEIHATVGSEHNCCLSWFQSVRAGVKSVLGFQSVRAGVLGVKHTCTANTSSFYIFSRAPLRNSARYMSGSSGRSLSQHSSAGRSSAKIPRSPM